MSRLARVRPSEAGVGFLICLVVYLVTAAALVLDRHLIVGDALSRVGSASYILFSRDPHLGAVGFVWGPLPTVLLLPLVALSGLWPPLVHDGFAASIVSSVAMAGVAYQLVLILREWGVGKVLRWTLIATFALHPLIVQYGANGDSEALFLLLLTITVRQLVVWLQSAQVTALVLAGLALSLAYLTRYETVAAAVAVMALVAAFTYLRSSGAWRDRARAASADALVVVVPFAMAFVLWALASWIIVGNPFEQFSSVYGTTNQLAVGAAGHTEFPLRLTISAGQILGLEPFAWLAAGLGALVVLRWADQRVLVVVAVFGSVLAFAVVAWLTNRTSGWLRYAITVIPMTMLIFAALLSRIATQRPAALRLRRSVVRAGSGVVAIALLTVAIPTTLNVMVDPIVGREDHYWGYEAPRYTIAKEVAGYLDEMHLPNGSVLIDTFLGFPIVLDSDNLRQFVLTSDRDFEQTVADPMSFNVRFILVPEGGGLGGLDAVASRWPGLYSSGSGIAKLVREFGIDGSGFRWRLFELGS